ncbi:MAG: hypothetical protein AAFR04_14810, partial [Pseudomonadota bacterium]
GRKVRVAGLNTHALPLRPKLLCTLRFDHLWAISGSPVVIPINRPMIWNAEKAAPRAAFFVSAIAREPW